MSDSTSNSSNIANWVQDLRNPTKRDEAARKIHARYVIRLLEFVRVDIPSRFHGRFSEESVVQEAFVKFFQEIEEGNVESRDREGLLSLLYTIARNTRRDRLRRHAAAKRNPENGEGNITDAGAGDSSAADFLDAPQREHRPGSEKLLEHGRPLRAPEPVRRNWRPSVPLDPHAPPDSNFVDDPLDAALLEADPEEVAAVREAFAALSEDLQDVLVLYIQNFTNAEIARLLDIDANAVRRKLDLISERWRRHFEQQQAPRQSIF